MRGPATSCLICGKLLRPAEILYTPTGDVICQACTTSKQVEAGHRRSAEMARSLAYGNVLLGFASFFFNPLGAIGNAFYVVRRIRADAVHGEIVSDAKRRVVVAALGAVLGVLGVLASLLRAGATNGI